MAQQIINPQNSIVPVPKTQSVKLVGRRLVAWGLEVGLVVMSAAVPWGLGQYVLVSDAKTLGPVETSIEDTGEKSVQEPSSPNQLKVQVALNPVVQAAQQGWAWIAQIPPHQLHRTVPRATDIFWTMALVVPGVVAGGQLLNLSRSGSTWPKQWLKIQLISTVGGQLKLWQVGVRELVRWGVPIGIVAGAVLVTQVSLGILTPAVVGLLAMLEGVMALAPRQLPWHDRIAKTRVIMKSAGYLPISREPLAYLLPITGDFLSNGAESKGIQLYGEAADEDDWWLTEAEGNLTSVVLAPKNSQTFDTGSSLILSERSALPGGKRWWILASGMLLACVAGFAVGRGTRPDVRVQTGEDVFLQTAQKLAAQPGGDYRAAILMLAQVEDPRTAQYLTDLLSQSSQPDMLATIQQALVSQGLDSLSPLLALNRMLENELQQSLSADDRQIRLDQRHMVQGAIAKLLTIHSNQLAGVSLERVNLGFYRDSDRVFRLIQPGLRAAGSHWQGANLNQANLAGASFFDVGNDGVANSFDDRISDLTGTNLVGASLEKANLQGGQLGNANLRRTNLTDANLTYGNLEQAQLTNARLVNVTAVQSYWQGSNLVGADLTQAQFNRADLSQARLNRIEASHSSWQQATLAQSDWVGANLVGADFSQASLSGANFQGANLDSANLYRADLRQANLREADLRQTHLIGANLADADLAGAIFHDGTGAGDSFITPNAQLSSDNHLQGVNFSRVRNLDGRQLNYICAQGGIHPACQAPQNSG